MRCAAEAGSRATLALLLVAVACAAEHRDATQLTAVRQVIERVIAADNAGDVDAVMAQYAADAVLLPPGAPAVAGAAAIRARYAAGFQQFRLEVAFESHETRVAGDWAFDRGVTRGRLVWHDGRPPTPLADHYLMVLIRQPDGAWKIARLMWSPTAEE